MSNQLKHQEASYVETTFEGFDVTGAPVYQLTDIAYTYLFAAYEFGTGGQSDDGICLDDDMF